MSTSVTHLSTLAHELFAARANRAPIAVPPSAREGGLDLDTAYGVEAELVELRRAAGRTTVGRKVGFPNKAMWPVLKLHTVVWAHMYDDTVKYADNGQATLSLQRMMSPRIEPEVVFKLRAEPASGDPVATLDAVEWVALGFEIIDCPFPGWKFHPADLVASFGFHAGLIVGTPRAVEPGDAERLAALTVRLSKNGALVEQGHGKNVLSNPALCLGELASAIAARPGMQPLSAGEVVSTGSLTAAQPIAAGEQWDVVSEGSVLAPLTLQML